MDGKMCLLPFEHQQRLDRHVNTTERPVSRVELK